MRDELQSIKMCATRTVHACKCVHYSPEEYERKLETIFHHGHCGHLIRRVSVYLLDII